MSGNDAREGATVNHETTADQMWRKALLPGTATVQEAIRNLDDTTLQIALVVTPDAGEQDSSVASRR